MRTPGITDVAKAAGVSTTTVSRVLNGVATVSDDNRRRVMSTIRRLHYHPNPSAQRLASGRHNTIGLILPRFEDMFRSYHVTELLKGVGTAAERLRLDLLVHVTTGESPLEILPVGGILFADIDGNEDQLDWVMDHHLPCVVMAHYVEELPVSCVAVNNRAAAREAVEYLIRLGHREIATITGHLRTPIGLERLDGYLDALKAHQLPVKPHFIEHGDYTGPSAAPAAKRLLERRDRPTAIFAASDAMAVAVMDVAQELRLRVPEDLSVVGFDDSAVAQAAKVPLTTVWQPLSRVGELATDILAKAMAEPRRAPVKKRLDTKLVERQSCRQTWLEHG